MSDLLAWGESWAKSWAKSRGYWVENSAHKRKGWCVRAAAATFQVCHGGDDGFDGWTTLTPAEFYLFALAHDDGRSARRVCPDLERRHGSQPCLTCDALGYIDTPLARVVCEAMPRECPRCRGDGDLSEHEPVNSERFDTACPDCGARGRFSGSPAARTELLQAAYGLLVGWTDQERRRVVPEDPAMCGGCGLPREFAEPAIPFPTCECPPAEDPKAGPLRDHLESHGVRVAPDRTLALTPDLAQASGCKPHGDLGAALMAWLGGEACGTCNGAKVESKTRRVKGPHARVVVRQLRQDGWTVTPKGYGQAACYVCTRTCKDCHGEGTALAALAVADSS